MKLKPSFFPLKQACCMLSVFLIYQHANAQVAYPDSIVIIQGVTWTNGTNNVSATEQIISPDTSASPVSISGSAQVSFVAGKVITLGDGFHAGGFSGNGYFHARIDTVLATTTASVLLVAPDSTHIESGIVHVNKWEKFEIAFKLPQVYENAVDSFLTHYYTNTVDTAHDLNPYADDSLSVEVDLTSPTGAHYTKWAFYMKQGQWVNNPDFSGNDSLEILGDDTTSNILNNYHWHLRFAPNEANSTTPWTFNIIISAPYSSQTTFTPDTFCGLQFMCDASLSDNHGYLNVNTNNHRYYVFDDGTPFFGIGEDMPDQRHWYHQPYVDWQGYFKMDYENYYKNFSQMSSNGANYMRMWLYHENFAVEEENLGVYDYYSSTVSTCTDGSGGEAGKTGNRQWYLWSLDQIINEARATDIYIQLTLDLDNPQGNAQNEVWGNNCYIRKYVYPTGTSGYGSGQFLHPEYFYVSNPAHRDTAGSAEYYWKRRYKYISSRWGYAVNLAAYESFNEVDQTLMYTEGPDSSLLGNDAICTNDQMVYSADTINAHIGSVRDAIVNWHTDIGSYLKNTLADRHLFTVSSTGFGTYYYWWMQDSFPNYNAYERMEDTLFYNPYIDMVDIHNYSDELGMQGANRYDPHNVVSRYWLSNEWAHCDTCPSDYGSAIYRGLNINKPLHFGEGSSYGTITENDSERASNAWGNNYELSFHNELWATAMMGCNTTLLTWNWEIVHRWNDGCLQNLGDTLKNLIVANPIPGRPDTIINIIVSTMFHNYKRLSEFMDSIDTRYITYVPHKYYNNATDSIECYYLVQSDSSTAYGWVHNMNKYWKNAYYYQDQYRPDSVKENYFGCERSMQPPDSFTLSNLMHNHLYYVYFKPTRLGSQTLPNDTAQSSDNSGNLTIHLWSAPLGCDSTNADYAFVLSSFVRRMANPNKNPSQSVSLDFNVFPNPSRGIFNVDIPINDSLQNASIDVLNPIGKMIFNKSGIKISRSTIDISNEAKGIYYIRLTLNNVIKVKRIIVL